jgi:hypothetical protein
MTVYETWKDLIPENFAAGSRVWIYQSNRPFGVVEALQIEALLEDFSENWQSHGAKVKGFATLLLGRFIILMADETDAGVSGCSTDSSVRLIKEIEQRFHVELFDRMSLAFLVKDNIQLLPLQQLDYAFENGFITAGTLYFDNLVNNKKALLERWIVPVKDSWLAPRIKPAIA